MSHEMQHARIAGPIEYGAVDARHEFPRGPCLLEHSDAGHVDVIWGDSGEHSMKVPVAEVKRAADRGDLVLVS